MPITNGWIRFAIIDMNTRHTQSISLLGHIEPIDRIILENKREPVHSADLSSECGNSHILANERHIADISHAYERLAHENTHLQMCLRMTQNIFD